MASAGRTTHRLAVPSSPTHRSGRGTLWHTHAMHRTRRGRVAAAALALVTIGAVGACTVPPGSGDVSITGAVTADDPEGTVICKDPCIDGETQIPTWQWDGTIDGEAATLSFSSQISHIPEEGALRVGTRWWVRLGGHPPGSTITPQPVTDDGTLRVTAHLEPGPGQAGGAVDIVAALRCPGWGDVTLAGAVAGELDGVSRCPAPGEGGSDAYSTFEVRSARFDGQPDGTITFAGLAGPAVDSAVLRSGGVVWGAANQPGLPPQIEASVDDAGVLERQCDVPPPRRPARHGHRRGDDPLPLRGRHRPVAIGAATSDVRRRRARDVRRGRAPGRSRPARRWRPRGR